jgi:hypothetical protein
MKTHVSFTATQSTSKTLFNRDVETIISDSVLLERLSIYGVSALEAQAVNENQSEIVANYRTPASDAAAIIRAHLVDGYIGGWMDATRKAEGVAGYQPL